MSDDLFWATARRVCTEKQLRVLELRERHGFSLRQIAFTCNIGISTVRMHLDAAKANLLKELADEEDAA